MTRAAPDLAVEILSPATSANDRGRKKRLLGRHGVLEYWLVDPEAASIELFVLSGGELRLEQTARGSRRVRSVLLTQLSLAPSELFLD